MGRSELRGKPEGIIVPPVLDSESTYRQTDEPYAKANDSWLKLFPRNKDFSLPVAALDSSSYVSCKDL
ncbi:hypothetical protein LDENG_00281050 [Lucifuga dentata]|nr:hypothetical protein LDENG_00281050 [Lucifuga dentata]